MSLREDMRTFLNNRIKNLEQTISIAQAEKVAFEAALWHLDTLKDDLTEHPEEAPNK